MTFISLKKIFFNKLLFYRIICMTFEIIFNIQIDYLRITIVDRGLQTSSPYFTRLSNGIRHEQMEHVHANTTPKTVQISLFEQ